MPHWSRSEKNSGDRQQMDPRSSDRIASSTRGFARHLNRASRIRGSQISGIVYSLANRARSLAALTRGEPVAERLSRATATWNAQVSRDHLCHRESGLSDETERAFARNSSHVSLLYLPPPSRVHLRALVPRVHAHLVLCAASVYN